MGAEGGQRGPAKQKSQSLFKIDHSPQLLLRHHVSANEEGFGQNRYSLCVVQLVVPPRGRSVSLVPVSLAQRRTATGD
jgi:hypothetical protein